MRKGTLEPLSDRAVASALFQFNDTVKEVLPKPNTGWNPVTRLRIESVRFSRIILIERREYENNTARYYENRPR